MHILLNVSNLGARGPRVVLENVVPLLGRLGSGDLFTLVLPSTESAETWNLSENVCVKHVSRTRPHEIGRMWDLHIGLTRLCRELEVDVCFTLGDIGPISPGVAHCIFLHTPYIVYPESYLYEILPAWERLKLRYLRWHFGQAASQANAVIVQTPVMADRAVRCFGLSADKVHVVPMALPDHVHSMLTSALEPYSPMLAVEASVRLFFLASSYVHKNHKILLPLIAELRNRGLDSKVHFFLNLNQPRSRREAALLSALEPHSDMVTNLGWLPASSVAPALATADALFMPTLVETFGLIYLEAMACGTQILTSDRDFSRWVCGDLALYFDPTDPLSIADSIDRLIRDGGEPNYKYRARERLGEFPQTWDPIAKAYLDILSGCLT